MATWTPEHIEDLTGRSILVTGANSGIGFEAAAAFVRKNATVTLACRNLDKAHRAAETLREETPGAKVRVQELDLADLDSVRAFADAFPDGPLDALVNNAGVMALPLTRTAQGFEMQFGTNHLGHFALTGLLLDRLVAAPTPRIVSVASHMHRIGTLRFDDLNAERSYQRWLAYGQSKLANLVFTFELARRLEPEHAHVAAVACHPGYSNTHLHTRGADMDNNLFKRWFMLAGTPFSQSAAMGAQPTMYAATHPSVRTGDYIGPNGPFGIWGAPTRASCSSAARNAELGARLWSESIRLTGVDYLA